jgi:hypothetical protein
MQSIHIYVIVITLTFYALLKHFKQSCQSLHHKKKQKSNLVYLLFMPVVLYAGYYLRVFDSSYCTSFTHQIVQTPKSDSILSASYPASVSSIT